MPRQVLPGGGCCTGAPSRSLQTPATPAAALAHHALHAGLLAETIHHSLIAGNEAMAIFAVRVAITHYETAWQLAEQRGWPEEVSGADRQALYERFGPRL